MNVMEIGGIPPTTTVHLDSVPPTPIEEREDGIDFKPMKGWIQKANPAEDVSEDKTFECTFCVTCAEEKLDNVCTNCGGTLVERPIRPAAGLEKFPPSEKRVFKPEGCA